MTEKADFGMIGLAVMGRNFALNVADRGYRVAVYNLEPELLERALAESGGRFVAARSLEELVGALARPRRIMMLIKAGEPVDIVLRKLKPLLEPGDIVIDGGNSLFEDTERRDRDYAEAGLCFFGMGVSGGEEGARHGPSLMPGGSREAYSALAPIFEAVAAKTDSGACVTYVGKGGAGHFVKMVHNGIEYADMQMIAEAYHVLRELGGLSAPQIADVFAEWNRGPLESFLVEITSKILRVTDPKGGGALEDQVLDSAGQKGTGRWTAQVALELGVAVPAIAAAIDARVLSSLKAERVRASSVLAGPSTKPPAVDARRLVSAVHDALFASKVCAYAQGMALIAEGSRSRSWGIDLREMARIWKGGCIIRARFLDTIRQAYEKDAALPNLLIDSAVRDRIDAAQAGFREVVSTAQQAGIAVPAMSASLAYYDAYRSAWLPANLIQAQRDAFGAHTYQRTDDPQGPSVHTDWLG